MIEDFNETEMEKKTFRKNALRACHVLNEERLRKEMETKEKGTKIRKD
jgi:stalled ribosome alternative rescue factor ArfA